MHKKVLAKLEEFMTDCPLQSDLLGESISAWLHVVFSARRYTALLLKAIMFVHLPH